MSADGELLTLLPPRGNARPDHEAPEEAVAPGHAFATVKGPRAARSLEFIRRDGSSFCVPYGYLPLCWWQPPGSLLVEYPGLFTVALHGHGLAELKARLADHRLLWVRECEEGAGLPVAITRITLLRSYPSRDGDISGGDR